MYFDVLEYFDVADIEYFYIDDGSLYFTLILVSKSTGEILDITLTEELFDKVLIELEVNLMHKKGKLARLWRIYE